MANEIFDTARKLQTELAASPEFMALQTAFANMKKDDVAYSLFKQFQDVQVELQQKQIKGEDLTDDEIDKAQALAQKVGNIQVIKDLMAKEREMSKFVDEMNKIISKPITDLYQGK
ncbi:hypothetical protein IV38_GL000646 [Lactobacillus selangorensis]|uniref:UPF0342 protein IV38_GL000646 n=1 Tax=Lactobacillus selangorensis TaxID=81857 RepID=A0A0R2FNM9_9LACO|nr:YlbF family regulator [Lactobacillus selangorensis]KRN29758.1 hypothetical protein IV38_GL000646 [Lactobacillus selangorensis]KRN33713.1 hypothetical protein IV40_GL000021 [Lactobacillus selangorensis]